MNARGSTGGRDHRPAGPHGPVEGEEAPAGPRGVPDSSRATRGARGGDGPGAAVGDGGAVGDAAAASDADGDGAPDGDEAPDGAGEGNGAGEHEAPAPAPQQVRDESASSTHALTTTTPGVMPPRPPRRTGIFVDPEDLREHVGQLLRAILGGYEVDAFGNYTFSHEGARIFVTIGTSPIGPTIGVFSVTNLEIDLTPTLASFLLTTNHSLGFGAFSYDADNRSVWLRHTLLGTTLDGPELQSAVAAVATSAARLDDHIRDRFGGRTFQEAPGEVQRRVEPPGNPDGGHPGATGYL